MGPVLYKFVLSIGFIRYSEKETSFNIFRMTGLGELDNCNFKNCV